MRRRRSATSCVRAQVDIDGLSPDDLLVEVVYGRAWDQDTMTDVERVPLTLQPSDDGATVFAGTVSLDRAGSFGYTVRVTPHHVGLSSPAEGSGWWRPRPGAVISTSLITRCRWSAERTTSCDVGDHGIRHLDQVRRRQLEVEPAPPAAHEHRVVELRRLVEHRAVAGLLPHRADAADHPAVYIMILPAMGVMSELISTFSRKKVFGY